MTQIGHNSPPPFDAFSMALDDAYDTAKDFLDGQPIESQGQADSIGRIVAEVKKLRKDADAERQKEKKPHLAMVRAIDAKWKPLDERCETIIKAAQAPLTAYLRQLDQQQREAERQAKEEADRKAAEAAAAARLLATEEGGVEALDRVQQLEKDAEEARKKAAQAGKQKAHVAGMDRAIGLRTYQVAEVTDYAALLKHVRQADPEPLKAWLDEYARKALPSQLPGVTIRTERKVA